MAARRTPALGRFRRPVWRDGAFWAAVALTAVVFGIQVLVAGNRSGWLAWASLALRLVATWVVISALIRLRIGLERGLVAGYTEAEAAAEARRRAAGAGPGTGATSAEAAARAAGRLAGRASRAYRRRGGGDR